MHGFSYTSHESIFCVAKARYSSFKNLTSRRRERQTRTEWQNWTFTVYYNYRYFISRETRKKSLSFHQSVKHHINIIPCLCFWVVLPNTSAGDRIRSTHKLDLPSRLPGWDQAYRRLSEGKLPTTNARSFIVSTLKVVNGRMLRRGLAEFFFRAVMIFFGLVVLSFTILLYSGS